MHCWKTFNIKHEYGTTRLTLWSVIIFVLVFSFSYISFGYLDPVQYTDDFVWLFFIALLFLYPIHKLVHYISLFKYRKNVQLKLKFDFTFIPVINIRLKDLIPKNYYIFVLLLPFLLINSLLIFVAYSVPEYTHYSTILLAFHSSICLMDILCVKNLLPAPKNAVIEETPKGYEILVPPSNL
ncbi:DUF3267 domain-containing protein [Ureibacillus manganicus]|uniref:DUF3267 domain-containing protein n=1 Tax=Ureibacillus manganicus DSM 26584 TaxID=1384049 RepID=A0A0A3IYR9_9BACL|nr:DUF3267 domain-containing protein [Ureibacillus manganicus]KGR79967.1 hypothetical protein CD29_03140 [Ureibacillus manganicus DSM 26584]